MFACYFYATFCEIFRSERSECALVKFTSHDNYEKINSWVSFNFHIWDACGAPLGGPSGRRSSAINFDWVVRFQGMVTKTKKVKMAADSNEEKQSRLVSRLWVSLKQLQNPKFGKTFCTLKKRFKKHLKNRKEKFTELKRYGELYKR